MALMWLPSELLAAILIDLDLRNLLHCREVCTRFKTLIDEDVRAQYKLELAIAGMEDGVLNTSTTAERLSTLRVRQNAWSKFAWTAKEDVPMRMDEVWELSGNVLAQSEGERTLHLKQIPSVIRGIEGTEWIISDMGYNITEIGMDPVQDLLLVIEHFEDDSQLICRINVHLRTLSTGVPHPAGPPTAMLTHQPEPGRYSYTIQTSESHLGVLMSSQTLGNPSELLIWDWKTGTLHLHLIDPELNSWAFLASYSLLIAHGGTAFDAPHLVVIDLDSLQSSNPVALSDINYMCAFHYPLLEDNVNVLDMPIRSDPGASWCPSPALGVPFSVSPEDRLFVITLWLVKYDEETVLLSLVPTSTFRRALATLVPGETRRQFEWAEWGPRGSRFMEAPSMYTTADVRNARGMAFVTVEHQLGVSVDGIQPARVRGCVVVRDFNQLAVRRRAAGHSEPGTEEQDIRVVADATALAPADMFKEEVTTSLPYVERVFEPFHHMEDKIFNTPMLAEDALVLVAGTWQSPPRYCIFSV